MGKGKNCGLAVHDAVWFRKWLLACQRNLPPPSSKSVKIVSVLFARCEYRSSYTQMKETARSPETLVHFYQTARCNTVQTASLTVTTDRILVLTQTADSAMAMKPKHCRVITNTFRIQSYPIIKQIERIKFHNLGQFREPIWGSRNPILKTCSKPNNYFTVSGTYPTVSGPIR